MAGTTGRGLAFDLDFCMDIVKIPKVSIYTIQISLAAHGLDSKIILSLLSKASFIIAFFYFSFMFHQCMKMLALWLDEHCF